MRIAAYKPTIWKAVLSSTQNSLLGNVRFMQLWAGQAISFVGDAVSMVALVILVVQLTGSASAVGGALHLPAYCPPSRARSSASSLIASTGGLSWSPATSSGLRSFWAWFSFGTWSSSTA